MPRGLILFAHGSRDPAWGASLHALARELGAQDATLEVRCAFLELQAPDLGSAVAELAPQVQRLWVCPVFWAANGHVRRDLPALLDEVRRAHPRLQLELLPALSDLPGMLPFLAGTLVTMVRAPG
jgi:sirohydrochlorin cobaltochelatase